MVERKLPAYPVWWGFTANVVGGIGVIYAIGIPVQAAVLGTKTVVATAIAAGIYLPGDLSKVIIATFVAAAVHRGYPTVLPSRGVERETAGSAS